MKILLKGYYGFGNLGDDILMIICYRIIKSSFPDSEVFIYSNYNEKLTGFPYQPSYNNYIKTLLNANVNIVDWTYTGHFDLVVNGGGGIYWDELNKTGNWKRVLINKILNRVPIPALMETDRFVRKLLRREPRLSFSRRLGLGIGIGRYHFSSQVLYDHLVELGTYDKLVVRDEFSFSFLIEHGMPKDKVILNTDLAFLARVDPDNWPRNVGVERLGIIISGSLPTPMTSNLLLFGKLLEGNGVKCSFYSFDSNFDQGFTETYKDFPLHQYSPAEATEFLKELGGEHLLYTARAHGAILGACLGVPSIILGVSIKLKQVAKMLKHSSMLLEEWDLQHLTLAFDKAKAGRSELVDGLRMDISFNHNKALINLDEACVFFSKFDQDRPTGLLYSSPIFSNILNR